MKTNPTQALQDAKMKYNALVWNLPSAGRCTAAKLQSLREKIAKLEKSLVS